MLIEFVSTDENIKKILFTFAMIQQSLAQFLSLLKMGGIKRGFWKGFKERDWKVGKWAMW